MARTTAFSKMAKYAAFGEAVEKLFMKVVKGKTGEKRTYNRRKPKEDRDDKKAKSPRKPRPSERKARDEREERQPRERERERDDSDRRDD